MMLSETKTLSKEKRRRETPTIKLEGVTAGYNGVQVIKNASFYHQGVGVIQVLGPNGSGKTTLLKVISGLLKPLKGSVYINGLDVTGKPSIAGKLVGYVPQMMIGGRGEGYPITVWEILEYEYKFIREKWPRILPPRGREEHIASVLTKVGLEKEVWNKNFAELSGGQKQRVLIARALLHRPPIMLMDEPLSSIDPKGRGSISRLIGKMGEETLVIVTSHDPVLLLGYTKKIILLGNGEFYSGTPEEMLCEDVLTRIYGESAVKVSGIHIHIADAVCKRR
jgi:zinc/manganese transport system ATP-binding protein